MTMGLPKEAIWQLMSEIEPTRDDIGPPGDGPELTIHRVLPEDTLML